MGTTAAVLTVGYNIREQKKREERTAEAQERSARVEIATRASEARKSRREQIREARVRQAEIENISATSGQTGSSAAVAAGASLQARLGTNIGAINTRLLSENLRTEAEQDIFEASRRSTGEIVSGAAINLFV